MLNLKQHIMKTKLLLIFALILFISYSSTAQDTIAAWTFPTGTAIDANPDYHNAANAAVLLTTGGGTSVIDWTKNGFTTKAAQTTGWDAGANTKYWQIEVNTTNFNNLKLYSKQTAGGANPGPRDWKAQYKVGSGGTWADIPSTTLVNANIWTSAVLANVSIPSACNDQASVFVRWLMTSDTSSAPPALVLANGTTKIDDIYVLGSIITSVDELQRTAFSVFPNPCNGSFTITSSVSIGEISIFNFLGKQVYHQTTDVPQQNINLAGMEKGVYFVRFSSKDSHEAIVQKILIQ
jgi:hypothetical protein